MSDLPWFSASSILLLSLWISCSPERADELPSVMPISHVAKDCPATIEDADGNVYPVVQIGKHCWMADNLRTTTYANGVSILDPVAQPGQWDTLQEGMQSGYGTENNRVNGGLYNYMAVRDPRGICPRGWHVATDDEWSEMVLELDPRADPYISGIQSTTAGVLLKQRWSWDSNDSASNWSGFGALSAGRRLSGGSFDAFGSEGWWWTATALDAEAGAWSRTMYHDNGHVDRGLDVYHHGLCVRCVQDED